MYKEFLDYIEKHNNIFILGKGKLLKSIPTNFDLYVGIKQSIGILPKKDILIMNDFEGIFGIEKFINEIKFILIPDMIHIDHQPNKEYNNKLYDFLKKNGFKGKIINYQIMKDLYKNVKNLDIINTKNSGDVIFHFLNKINKTFNVTIYGMYSSLQDNIDITKLIIQRSNKEFLEEYNSYIRRIYTNKKGVNVLMLKNNLDRNLNEIKTTYDLRLLLIDSQNKLINKYPNLKIKFN
tara:strand:- start:2117 stop:2824 length:708 start_codon:yes stop_codon:yes gene_type:complete